MHAPNLDATRFARLKQAIHQSNGDGLFELAVQQFADETVPLLAPGVRFWQGFSVRFLKQVCSGPDGDTESHDETAQLTDAELTSLILNVPPVRGAEYIEREVLANLWKELHEWLRDQLQQRDLSLSDFLQERIPQWHQVGRVCFHLAENRRHPDHTICIYGNLRARYG